MHVAIPQEMGHLSQLTALYLRDNQLVAIPPELGALSRLTELWLNNNQLQEAPKEIDTLKKKAALFGFDNDRGRSSLNSSQKACY